MGRLPETPIEAEVLQAKVGLSLATAQDTDPGSLPTQVALLRLQAAHIKQSVDGLRTQENGVVESIHTAIEEVWLALEDLEDQHKKYREATDARLKALEDLVYAFKVINTLFWGAIAIFAAYLGYRKTESK